MYITIVPTGGLCNKLRVIFTYYMFAKAQNKLLYVIWEEDEECPGYFLDYFEQVDGIIFDKTNSRKLNIDYKGAQRKAKYFPNYENLKLNQYLKEKITSRIELLNNNYIAVHIRRTDHTELAKGKGIYTSDETFFKFIDEDKQACNLYIAT